MKSFSNYVLVEKRNVVTLGSGDEIDVTVPKRARDQEMVYVDARLFDAAFKKDKPMYIGRGGRGGIGKRYDNFGVFVRGGKTDIGSDIMLEYDPADSIEVSEVYVNELGYVSFTNGRHRWAWLRDHGATSIPVVMNKESIVNAKKHNYIK